MLIASHPAALRVTGDDGAADVEVAVGPQDGDGRGAGRTLGRRREIRADHAAATDAAGTEVVGAREGAGREAARSPQALAKRGKLHAATTAAAGTVVAPEMPGTQRAGRKLEPLGGGTARQLCFTATTPGNRVTEPAAFAPYTGFFAGLPELVECGPGEWGKAAAPKVGRGAKFFGQPVDHLTGDAEELANSAEAPPSSGFARDPPLPGESFEQEFFPGTAAGAQAGEVLQRRSAQDAAVTGDEIRGRVKPLRIRDGPAGERVDGRGRIAFWAAFWATNDHEGMLDQTN